MRTIPVLLIFAASAFAQSSEKSSKQPPKGAPWIRSFAEARTLALKSGKPIFLYSTKTY